jgi:hypothetical protein
MIFQNILDKLKKRWEVSSNFEVLIIFTVFAITGSTSAYLSKPFTQWLGISKESLGWLDFPIRLIIIFPIYQILLVLIGSIFGQFRFFWKFEKKILKRMRIDGIALWLEKKFS